MTKETKLIGYRKVISCTTCFMSHEITDIALGSYSTWSHSSSEESGEYFGLWFDVPWSVVHAIHIEGKNLKYQEGQLHESEAIQRIFDHVAESLTEFTFQGVIGARIHHAPFLESAPSSDHAVSTQGQLLSAMEVRI